MTEAIDTSRSGPYAGNGSTTNFAYGFTIGEDADLVVVLVTDSTGAEVVQTLTTHYTVNGAGDAGGGTLDMVTAPAAGESLWVRRATDLENLVDLQNRGSFVAQTVEDQLDKMIRGMQDLQEQVDRAVTVPLGEDVTGVEMPFVSQSGALFWDGSQLTTAQIGNATTITLPGSTVDNTIPRWDGTGGDSLQGSGVFISDINNVSGIATLSVSTGVKAGSGYLEADRILDASGNELIQFTSVASAVNEIEVGNAATGNDPTITMAGGDTNIGLDFVPKGSGVVSINGNQIYDTTLDATAANFRDDTAGKILTTDIVWDAAEEVALSDGPTIALDLSTGFNFAVTLTGNRTLGTPTNAKVGQSGYIKVAQDGFGSQTLAFAAEYEFASSTAPTLTTTASAEDMLYYVVISSSRIVITNALDIG
jgi:hypothetical protein